MNWCSACQRPLTVCSRDREGCERIRLRALSVEQPEIKHTCPVPIGMRRVDPFSTDVQSFRWHWIKVFWGAGEQTRHLIPGIPHRDVHGRVDYWETTLGKAWKETDSRERCWMVYGDAFVISDPPDE